MKNKEIALKAKQLAEAAIKEAGKEPVKPATTYSGEDLKVAIRDNASKIADFVTDLGSDLTEKGVLDSDFDVNDDVDSSWPWASVTRALFDNIGVSAVLLTPEELELVSGGETELGTLSIADDKVLLFEMY